MKSGCNGSIHSFTKDDVTLNADCATGVVTKSYG